MTWYLEHIGTNTSCGEAYACVVVADWPEKARHMAAEHTGQAKWRDPDRTTCEEHVGGAGVLLVAYAGGD